MSRREVADSNAPSRWQRVKRDKLAATTNVIFAGLDDLRTPGEHELP